MNIEGLSYAFEDQPELVHAINQDLIEFNLGLIDKCRSPAPRHS